MPPVLTPYPSPDDPSPDDPFPADPRRRDIAGLVPHAGRMVLLDAIVSHDDDRIQCRARIDPAADHPLAVNGGLSATALVEYAAQAMAVHGGLKAAPGAPPRPGRLVSLPRLELGLDTIDGVLDVTVEAHCLGGDESGQMYRFRVRHGDQELASGQATIMFSDRGQRS